MDHVETPKSSVNNDVHELKYRISQLEHLIVQSSLSLNTSSSLPSNSTLLHSPQGLVDRLNQLEGLLAASEHENGSLRKQIQLLTVEKNRQEVQLLEKVYLAETERKDVEYAKHLAEVKLAKAEKRLAAVEDYVNGLPSQEELDEAKGMIVKVEEEKELLQGNVTRLVGSMESLQKEKMEIEKNLRQLEIRLDELKPLEEAQETFVREGEMSPLQFTESQGIKDYITLQKAQLIRSTKIITSLKEKLLKLDSEKSEATVKISRLELDAQSHKEQLASSQVQITRLEDKLKLTEQGNRDLKTELNELKHQIQHQESGIRRRNDHIHSLVQLVTEIDLCIKDVENLVDLGRSLASGEEPSVTCLLGLPEDDLTLHLQSLEDHFTSSTKRSLDIAKACSKYDPNDPEWTLDRLVKVRSVRKHVRDLRNLAGDIYADRLGKNVENCIVQ